MITIHRNRIFAQKFLRPLTRLFQSSNVNSRPNYEETQNSYLKYTGILGLILGGSYICLNEELPKNHFLKAIKNVFEVQAAAPVSSDPRPYNFIADVVEKTSPGLVYIEITDNRRYDPYGSPFSLSNGSGFVVQSDGLILTNAHVVLSSKPHSSIKVRLSDGTEFFGKVEAVDVRSDLATIRIPKKDLPIIKLGNSGKVRPGEWVVAMGSPLSLSNTITVGIVSSVARPGKDLGLHNRDIDYIQTDAPITFGNSGGPLVNLDGEAIGINSMNVTPGISFAIPSDCAKSFLEKSILTTTASKSQPQIPKSHRKYLGITMLSLDPQIIYALRQKYHNIPSNLSHGVMVWKVVYDSPAHLAGLLPGDIITHINSNPITAAADVYESLENEAELVLTVTRQQKELKIVVVPE